MTDPQLQQALAGILTGLFASLLQWAATRWPRLKLLQPGTPNTTKRLAQVALVLAGALLCGAWTQATTSEVLSLFAWALATNTLGFTAGKGVAEVIAQIPEDPTDGD